MKNLPEFLVVHTVKAFSIVNKAEKGNYQTTKRKRKNQKKKQRINWKTKFKMAINTQPLNAPIKRHRMVDWVRKQEPTSCCIQKTCFRAKEKE